MVRSRLRVAALVSGVLVVVSVGVGLALGRGLGRADSGLRPQLMFSGRTVTVTGAPAETTRVTYYDRTDKGVTYLGAADRSPWALDLPAVTEKVQARLDDGSRTRLTGRVPVSGGSPVPEPASTPPPPPAAGPAGASTIRVRNAVELQTALDQAIPGQTIALAPGSYTGTSRRVGAYTGTIVVTRSGTASRPITIVGPADAVISGKSTGGRYGVYVAHAENVVLRGFTVTTASKGIVSDGGSHNRYERLTITDIGSEGLHLRANSAGNLVTGCSISNTGLRQAQYGEGIYVGSANSNWSTYSGGRPDASNDNQIVGNTFTHIAAEGADLKEGTTSGLLAGNVFDDTGYSGENSADSAIDVKGNGWTVRANTVRNPQGADLDAIQTHTVYDGFGTDNRISGNRIEGVWPGFGIGLNPANTNVVTCDNAAPQAARGLVGAGSKAVPCAG